MMTTHDRKGARPPLVSIVMPAYNEQDMLEELYRRVTAVCDGQTGYEFEFLLVDNCSEDDTGRLGEQFCQRDSRWRYLRFSRNFTAEVSLAAGMHYAGGEAIIFLSSDLQEPPECIPTMLAKWSEGYDVVYGRISHREDSGFVKNLGAKIAYKLIHALSDIKIPQGASDFRLITRPVIEALKRCDERNRYLRGLVHWVGFRQCSFPYEREPRKGGESHAGVWFCLHFALTALAAFSTTPLRWASIVGMLTTAASVLGGGVCLLLYVLQSTGVLAADVLSGWTSLVLLILFLGGAQCLFLGIAGEYIGRIYTETKRRPLWVVQQTAGFPADQDPLGGGGSAAHDSATPAIDRELLALRDMINARFTAKDTRNERVATRL